MNHELKCWPEYFQSIFDGDKHFELRKDDRNYQPGEDVSADKIRSCGWRSDSPMDIFCDHECAAAFQLQTGRAIHLYGWQSAFSLPHISGPNERELQSRLMEGLLDARNAAQPVKL